MFVILRIRHVIKISIKNRGIPQQYCLMPFFEISKEHPRPKVTDQIIIIKIKLPNENGLALIKLSIKRIGTKVTNPAVNT